jgi:hypothetical protein
MKDNTGLSNVQPIRTRLGRQVEGDLPINDQSDENQDGRCSQLLLIWNRNGAMLDRL